MQQGRRSERTLPTQIMPRQWSRPTKDIAVGHGRADSAQLYPFQK
jgi:hypothetical protein